MDDNESPSLAAPVPNSRAVAQALAQLSNIANSDVPTMPESIFVHHILPMLSRPPAEGEERDLSIWLDIAGTPLRPIDVVDVSGAVLFRLPALMRSLPTLSEGHDFNEMITTAQQKAGIIPQMGDEYLRQQLADVRLGTDKVDLPTAAAWNVIRQRYGVEPLGLPGDVQPAADTGAPLSTALSLSDEIEDL